MGYGLPHCAEPDHAPTDAVEEAGGVAREDVIHRHVHDEAARMAQYRTSYVDHHLADLVDHQRPWGSSALRRWGVEGGAATGERADARGVARGIAPSGGAPISMAMS